MVTEAQIITIFNILVALHLSRGLYKSTLFMQNKANLLNSRMSVTPVLTKDYENVRLHRDFKNKAKQTQSNPISNPLAPSKFTPDFPVFAILDISSSELQRLLDKQSLFLCGLGGEMLFDLLADEL